MFDKIYLYKCKECEPEWQWSCVSAFPSKLSTFIKDLGLWRNRLNARLILDFPLGAAVVDGPVSECKNNKNSINLEYQFGKSGHYLRTEVRGDFNIHGIKYF